MRIKPTPPSFKRTPARIILPAVGASTWAIGSHKCNPYTGSFTIKEEDTTKRNKGSEIKEDGEHWIEKE